MQFGIYALLVSGIVWVFWRVSQEIKQLDYSNKTIFIILFSCLTYALIVPRIKDYSYILLIVPLLYMITEFRINNGNTLLLILALLSTFNPWILEKTRVHLPLLDQLNFLWDYYTLFIIYGVWGVYAHSVFSRSGKSWRTFIGLPGH